MSCLRITSKSTVQRTCHQATITAYSLLATTMAGWAAVTTPPTAVSRVASGTNSTILRSRRFHRTGWLVRLRTCCSTDGRTVNHDGECSVVSNNMDKYRIVKTLGEGNFGVVYRASNISTGETVAIKKFKQKYSSWEECIELREVKSLRKLSHPNLIKLKEVLHIAG